jgi:hypothetical protein
MDKQEYPNLKPFSKSNQPSPKRKRVGKMIKAFRNNFFAELINLKNTDGELTYEQMLQAVRFPLYCKREELAMAIKRGKYVLKVIDILSAKDFDIEDVSKKFQLFMGGKEYPWEEKLANATDDEAS